MHYYHDPADVVDNPQPEPKEKKSEEGEGDKDTDVISIFVANWKGVI